MTYKGGYITPDGKYIPKVADVASLRQMDSVMFKAGDHDRQRKDFAKEIVQAYNFDGTPNEDFINAFPEESKQYGFIPTEEQIKSEGAQ